MSGEVFITQPGEVGHIPVFLIVVLGFIFLSRLINRGVMSWKLEALLIGASIPVWDDLLAFFIGEPFSHHSLMHSFIGLLLSFVVLVIIMGNGWGRHVFLGHLSHILYNFVVEYIPAFFPWHIKEISMSRLFSLQSAEMKMIIYPVILFIFFFSVLTVLRKR